MLLKSQKPFFSEIYFQETQAVETQLSFFSQPQISFLGHASLGKRKPLSLF